MEKQRELEDVRREHERSAAALAQKCDENKQLNESLEATLQRLEEANDLLRTNENGEGH